MDLVTKDDLQVFKIQLMDDIRKLLDRPEKNEEEADWIKSKQVRKILDVSPGTLQNLRISGHLKPKKIGGSWYYNRHEISALFTKLKTK